MSIATMMFVWVCLNRTSFTQPTEIVNEDTGRYLLSSSYNI